MDALCTVCGGRATKAYQITRLDTGLQFRGFLCVDCPITVVWDDPQPKPSDIKIDIYRNAAPIGEGQYLIVPETAGS
jgi:hypothetical protein